MSKTKMTLRELQLTELAILERFDGFCRAHGLKYTLCGGTLLGAVRHKGFIPWDDDIDIAMPRPDYERFYGLLEQTDFAFPDSSLRVIPDRGDGAKLPFMKIVDTDYKIDTGIGEAIENIWIDIFPFDGYPADDKKAKKLCKKLLGLRRIIVYNITRGKSKRGIKKLLVTLYMPFVRLYGTKRALDKMNKLVQKHPYGTSEKIGGFVWGAYGIGERISPDSFDNMTELEFEGKRFSAIANWDEYLSGIYGDYMTLPPEDKRETHVFTAYKIDDTGESK